MPRHVRCAPHAPAETRRPQDEVSSAGTDLALSLDCWLLVILSVLAFVFLRSAARRLAEVSHASAPRVNHPAEAVTPTS